VRLLRAENWIYKYYLDELYALRGKKTYFINIQYAHLTLYIAEFVILSLDPFLNYKFFSRINKNQVNFDTILCQKALNVAIRLGAPCLVLFDFVCGFFYDAVSVPDYTTSNRRMNSQYIIGNDLEQGDNGHKYI
jgi:hypothetical protein